MKVIRTVANWVLSLSLPYILIMFSIRLLFNPFFLIIEYNLPGFPNDPYGFTTQERLKWGTISMEYLFNNAGPDFLAELEFEDGTPIYNEREVSHMVDVKNLLQTTLIAFYVLFAVNLLIIIWGWLEKRVKSIWKALSRGGWITIGLIASIIFAIFISFEALFTAFHRIFFEGDTWLFYYSDTLIRLFPMRLWQDAFITMGLLTISLALFFALYGNKRS